jgi:hypothetical protein
MEVLLVCGVDAGAASATRSAAGRTRPERDASALHLCPPERWEW